MAISDENMVMPVMPAYGGGYGNMGYSMPVMPAYGGGIGGFGGGDWSWIIVLFLFAAMGGGFGGGFGGFGGNYEFPWLLNGQAGINQNTNAGFDNAALTSQLTGIQTTLNQNEVANCNRTIDQLQTAYSNQIAGMNQSFAQSQSLDNRLFDMQMAQQNCCCENRLGLANLTSTVISENCADREALSNGVRDIIAAQTAGTQRVLDQLCQDKIDAKNDTIAQLRSELLYSRGQASQDVQTARILAGQTSEVDALYNRLATCPVGTMPVYGNQPIFTCPQTSTNSCGCGCGGYNGVF